MHLIERLEKTDHLVDGDRVAPNLLFAQQISIFCCFTARHEAAERGSSQNSLIKKGYMEQDYLLHIGNITG